MATGPGFNQGKSAFLEEFLPGNRDADLDAVNRAWSAAGNEGTISHSLFGKLRSKLGLTGRRGPNGGATQESVAAAAPGEALDTAGLGKGPATATDAPSEALGRGG